MIDKLLTEHHLECRSLKGGCRGSSESTHVKMPHCGQSHALAHISYTKYVQYHKTRTTNYEITTTESSAATVSGEG